MKDTSIQYFFAASNSYDGFVSYFDEIFSPKKYEKIYILKGGPGTGKSSFIKNVLEKFKSREITAEGILCSSDPNSFDGVILEGNSKKIAIIDGTAPHSAEPIYPGAIEIIINLGDSWNEILLKNNKEIIKELSDLKKAHYTNAYQYLSVAKSCENIVFNSIKDVSFIDYKDNIESILKEIPRGSGNVDVKLKTAFGMRGFFDVETFKQKTDKLINVVGIYGSEYLFMNALKAELDRRFANYTISPSPLDKNKTEAIFLEYNGVCICTGGKNSSDKENVVDTSKFINIRKFEFIRSKLETLYKEREAMLWSATDEFKKAYDFHMELEKIYTTSMNFKKNKKLQEKVCSEISSILFPEDPN